ncbi:protein sel-1 homolog 3-like [Gastrophryne carolinensis]
MGRQRVTETFLYCLLLCQSEITCLTCNLLLVQSCWTQVILSQTGTSVPTTTRSFIEFLEPPKILSERTAVELLYHCQREQVVHVDLLASSATRTMVGIYKRRWKCSPENKEKVREIRLNLPDQIVYREDWLLRRSIYLTEVLLRAWISDYPVDFNLRDRFTYNRAVAKVTHHMEGLPPYSRPFKKHQRSPRWDQDLLWRIKRTKVPQCPVEQEVIPLNPFLYACTGEGFGITRSAKPYTDGALELQRQRKAVLPRCSFSTWVYVTNHCFSSFCGVLYHLDSKNDYTTPTVLMTQSGTKWGNKVAPPHMCKANWSHGSKADWSHGRKADWSLGRKADWSLGRKADWSLGRKADWSLGRKADWSLGRKADWSLGRKADWSLGRKADWSLGRKADWSLGRKADWSLGRKADWSLGRKADWSLGRKADWSLGRKADWSLGRKADWSLGRKADWSHGRKADWSHGRKADWSHGRKADWSHGRKADWSHGRKADWSHGRKADWSHGRKADWSHGRKADWSHGRKADWSLGRKADWSLGRKADWSLGRKADWSLGRKADWMCGRQHSECSPELVFMRCLQAQHPFRPSHRYLHVQVELANTQMQAFRSLAPIPLNQWCQILLTLDISLANLTVICGSNIDSKTFRFPDQIFLSDTVGTFHLGGCRYVQGINGFYGPSAYHRNKIVSIYKAEPPRIIERVEISQWFLKCRAFKDECSEKFQRFLSAAKSKQMRDDCRDVYTDLLTHYRQPRAKPQCAEWEKPPRPHRTLITRLLRMRASRGGHPNFNSELYGQALHRMYLKRVLAPEGLSQIRKYMPLLLQAGCLGYYPALYMASVLFQTGLGVKRDHYKALRFGLIAAQMDERLSQLSLGHKHHLGVDGFPLDHDLSYGYYANIARQTTVDRLNPDRNQAYVERVRVTDEKVLKQQTKEDDDLFMWLRFQAKQGVSSAQQAVGRMLFWGQQGISSNPEAAIKFYERGAVQQKDPVLMYDYGVVLLRGQGVKQDIPKALEYLKKAADMNFVPALNSLGWYYEHHEKNYEKAAKFWERADELGHQEAPFNLGILHENGKYPGKQRNLSAAYQYYLKSATRGHIDAAVQISTYWIQGVPGVVSRVPYDAMVWTKWAGEQNGYLGAVLRKALDSYLEQSWPAALLYYVQAAETGFEVGQFNAANLCEMDPEGVVTRHLQIDCEWKYYNLSVHSERPPAYALLKMGDLFYTRHSRRKRDVSAAVHMYTAAALQREPQGLYNLGILVEEGVSLPHNTLQKLGFNSSHTTNNYTIIMELYRRCRDHEKEDSYVPCSLALLNAHLQYVWAFHGSILKYSSAATITIVTALSLMTIFARLQNAARQLQLSV